MGKKSKRSRSKSKIKDHCSKSSTSSNSDTEEYIRKSLMKLKKRKRKSSSSSNDSDSSIDRKLIRKLKKKLKKKSKREKKLKDKHNRENPKDARVGSSTSEPATNDYNVDVSLMEKAKAMAPMTKEEWDKRQNTIKHVFDEESGRTRLIRGDGEILEECVSRERHLNINKQATKGDGEFFQKTVFRTIK